MNRDEVLAKLSELRAFDRRAEDDVHYVHPVLGYVQYCPGRWHRYRFDRTLTEKEVAAIEARHRFSVPRDYREFVLTIGDGGAGPKVSWI
jgi:hypothetical protein